MLNRFQVNAMVVADPNAWSFTLRSLVQQAQATGAQFISGRGPYAVDGPVEWHGPGQGFSVIEAIATAATACRCAPSSRP